MADLSQLSFENLVVEVDDSGIAVVTVSRPKALNALNDATMLELNTCFLAIGTSPEVRAVILTGSGEKAFVAGADISELADQSAAEAKARSLFGQQTFGIIEKLGKPVIAAINGFALGGGCELAMACHIRFASENARLGLPEVSLGIIPGFGGTQRLERIVGRGIALELTLSGDMIKAPRALDIGLVNKVCAADELMAEAKKLATTMCSRGPLALRYVLEAILRGGDQSLEAGCDTEADLFGLISDSADMREGMKAFLEKRPANFTGK